MLMLGVILFSAFTEDPQSLSGEINTWYKITSGKNHIGFMNSTIKQTSAGFQFKKMMNVQSPRYLESSYVVFDTNFQIKQFTSNIVIQGSPYVIKFNPVENSEFIFITFPNGSKQKIPTTGIGNLVLGTDAFILSAMRNGVLTKLKSTKLNFITLSQNAASLVELEFTNEGEKKEIILGKPATLYQFSIKGVPQSQSLILQTIQVDKYGRIISGSTTKSLGKTSKASLFEALLYLLTRGGGKETTSVLEINFVENESTARGNLKQLSRADSAHNPFNKDAVMTNKNKVKQPGDNKTGDITILLTDIKIKLLELEQMTKSMEKLHNENKNEELSKKYKDFILLYNALLKIVRDEEDLGRIRVAKEKAEKYGKGAIIAKGDALNAYNQMLTMMENYEFDGLEEKFKYITEVSRRIELVGDPVQQEILKIIKDAEALLTKSKNIQYLDSFDLKVTGIAYKEDIQTKEIPIDINLLGTSIKLKPRVPLTIISSYAIINGVVYTTGENIKVKKDKVWADTGIKVQTIDRDRVLVVYKDVQNELRFKGKK